MSSRRGHRYQRDSRPVAKKMKAKNQYKTFVDKKTKKTFRLQMTHPDDVNEIGDRIFGGRYYTLSEDPKYLTTIQG